MKFNEANPIGVKEIIEGFSDDDGGDSEALPAGKDDG